MGFLEDFTKCKYCRSKDDIVYLDTRNFALVCENCYSIGRDKKLGENPYESKVLTNALDEYIKRIVEEI